MSLKGKLKGSRPGQLDLQASVLGPGSVEDFYYAGGLPVVIQELKEYLHLDAVTVNGKTVEENITDACDHYSNPMKYFLIFNG